MKLTINKDYDCTKCGKYICCTKLTNNEKDHNFCFHCGEPIEWIAERTVEEKPFKTAQERIKEITSTKFLSVYSGNSGSENKELDKELHNQSLLEYLDELKSELLNLIKCEK